MNHHPFHQFLETFIPHLEKKTRQLNQALWLLETTGSEDAAALKADLDVEVRTLFSDPQVYKQLLSWDEQGLEPILKRQLHILIRAFKQNQIPQTLLEKITKKEAELALIFASFRPSLDGESLSENEIRTLLKTEKNVIKRKKTWEASKQIGALLAPKILELVALRNEVATELGYPDFFQMQLELQEVDVDWLLETLKEISEKSEVAYEKTLEVIQERFSQVFGSNGVEPWLWSEPFCQEDPLDSEALDSLVATVDMVEASVRFYDRLKIDVNPILQRSDMYERPGKNQHAFCINMDRQGDVRTLNNVCPSLKWLETILHELGHAIYELGFDPSLPWLLREPPHMITTEAMALLAGRQAYKKDSLECLIGKSADAALERVEEGLKRRQLIFSRWVIVMTEFERALYSNPNQNLNTLWWNLVEKHQKIHSPGDRSEGFDWACKYHIGFAPVYYFSYLLGEMFASDIQRVLNEKFGDTGLSKEETGLFLQQTLFSPGNRMVWSDLVTHVTGRPLSGESWVREFC